MNKLPQQLPFANSLLPDKAVVHGFPSITQIFHLCHEDVPHRANHLRMLNDRFFCWDRLDSWSLPHAWRL